MACGTQKKLNSNDSVSFQDSKEINEIQIDEPLAIDSESYNLLVFLKNYRNSTPLFRELNAGILQNEMEYGNTQLMDSVGKTAAYILKNYPDELYNYKYDYQTLIIQYAGYYLRTDDGREGISIFIDTMNKNSSKLIYDKKLYQSVLDQLIEIIER